MTHYMSSEEMYQAWCMHKKPIKTKLIAQKIGVSAASLSDLFAEISQILDGGRVRREKGRKNLKKAICRIRDEGNGVVEYPAGQIPVINNSTQILFDCATMNGKKCFVVSKNQYKLMVDDKEFYLFMGN